MGLRRLLPRRRDRALNTLLGAPRRAKRIRGLALESLEDRLVLSTSIPLSTGVWTALGPAPIANGQTPGANAVSGIITGIATNPTNASIIYVATSGGGVWKTFNAGSTWFPLTDAYATLNMGAIALAPTDPSLIYAGTGDANGGPNSDYGLGLMVSSNGGANWTFQNDGGVFTGQSISKIVVSPTNPDTLYVAVTGGGVNGVSAASATAAQTSGAVTSISVTSAGGGYTSAPAVTISGGGGIGATAAAVLNGGGSIASIVVTNGGSGYTSAPTVSIAAPSRAATGIYESTDGGNTWTNTTALISMVADYTDLVINPANPQNLYFAIGTPTGSSSNGVYGTINGGATWIPAGNFPAGAADGRIALGISSTLTTPTLYAAISNPSTGALLNIEKSTDGGNTWSVPYTTAPANYLGNQGSYDTYIAVSPTNPNTVFAAGSLASTSANGQQLNSILESTNGGSTWTDISAGTNNSGPHVGHHAYTFDANGNLLDGNDGGIWKLVNASTSSIQWADLNGDLQISQINGLALAPDSNDVAYASSAGNGIEEFNDNLKWTELQGGDGGPIVVDNTTTPPTLYRVTAFKVGSAANTTFLQQSINGGRSWTSETLGITTALDNGGAYPPLVIDPSNPDRLLVGTDHVYESLNQGATWLPISFPKIGNFSFSGWNSSAPITALTIAPSDPNTIYAATADGHVFVTNNDGNTWTQRDVTVGGNYIGGPETQFVVDPNNPGTVYTVRAAFNYGTDSGHVFMSTNGGQTWQDLSGNLPNLPTWSIVIDSRPATARMYVGTDNGVYSSSDGGVTWTPYKTGLPNVQVTQLVLDPTTDILAAGTHGRGLFEIGIQETINVQVTPPANVTAGELLNNVVVGSFADLVSPGPQSAYSASISWGDAGVTTNATLSPATGGGFLVAGSHTYNAAGTYTISVTVQNNNGNSGQNSASFMVADASLTTPANFTLSATEGQAFSGQVTTFQYGNTAAPASSFTATVTFTTNNSTGSTNTATGRITPDSQGNGVFDVSASNFYSAFGTYPVTVAITDSAGTTITANGTANVNDAALFSTPQTFVGVAGTSFNGQVASFTDSNPVGALTYTATINWGDNSGTSTGTIAPLGTSFTVSGTHLYKEPGTYTATVTINDAGGATTTAASTARVGDAALVATSTSLTAAKGVPLASNTVIATFTDGNIYAVQSDFSATSVDWGDNSASTGATIVALGGGKFSVEGTHTYSTPGTFPITVKIKSVLVGGSTVTTNSTALVADTPVSALGVTMVMPNGGATVVAGAALNGVLVATFTDPYNGALSYYGATIDWGDNTPTTNGTISVAQGQYSVFGSHAYSQAGKFAVTVTIQDGGGGTASVTSPAQVVAAPLAIQPANINPVVVGNSFTTVVASFSDPNPFDDTIVAQTGILTSSSPTVMGLSTTSLLGRTVTGPGIAPGTYVLSVNSATEVTLSQNATVTGPESLVFTQPNPQNYFVSTVDWGNGTVNAGQFVAVPGGYNILGTNTYSQLSGPSQVYSITITIVDESAPNPYVVNNTVQVQDATITPGVQTFSAVDGSPFNGVAASFVDGNPLAPQANFSALINWGDGNTSAGTVQAQGGGNFTVSGTNTYASPGTYSVSASISEIGGSTIIANSKAVVGSAALTPAGNTLVLTAFQGTTFSGNVVEFSYPNPSASAAGFTATIKWGDGNVSSGNIVQLGAGVFEVTGSNTYASAGSFPVAATITRVRGSSQVLSTTAMVVAPLLGSAGNGGFTSNTQPTFSGTAQPGAVISLFLTPSSSSNVAAAGRAVVDATGHWSAQVNQSLADGTYNVTATMVTSVGVAAASVNLGTLQIDTQGPTVAGVTLTPGAQQLRVTFQDTGSGVNPASIANAGNYVLSSVVKGKLRSIAPVTVQTVAGPGSGQLTEIITYNSGRKLAAGTYVVTLNAPGLTDRAGNSLVETRFVTFPQTGNVPNPDYVAQFNVNKRLAVTGPFVYIPTADRVAASRFGSLIRSRKIRRP
jgi:hypothetical protein